MMTEEGGYAVSTRWGIAKELKESIELGPMILNGLFRDASMMSEAVAHD